MNILIVGLGSIARKHIEAIKFLNCNVTIYAFRSTNNVIDEDGIFNVFNLDNLNITFHFAIISNPTHLHYKFIQIFAIKNIPIFIEKPAIHTLENSTELVNLIKANNVISYVACNLRFHPCILFIKEYIHSSSNRINEVNVYCGSYLPHWRPNRDFRKIYSANDSMGGGVHLDLFHELDYTLWIFGFPIKSSSIKKSVSSLAINAVDYANYVLEYNDFTINVLLNYYRIKAKRTIEIVFENHIITVDLINCIVLDDKDKVLFQDSNFEIKNTYFSQMKYFMNCLKHNLEPFNSFQESIEILKIVLQNDK
uniref:Gfo/Idh/MocA family protein n=1 Tax=Algoriphagus sp. TaxID=1872435 RepID=UPI004047BC7D